jgi:outer membrane protein assembly factor BamB
MFRKFLKANSPGDFVFLNWMQKIEGVIRVAIFDTDSEKVFVVAYLEQNNQYSVFALNRDSGQLFWTKNIVQGGYGAPALLNEIVICPTKFTDIIALSKEDGYTRWVFQTSHRVRSSINVINEKIYFSSGNTIFELRDDGTLLSTWSYEGAFFYGSVDIQGELITTLGTIEDSNGESTITVFSFKKVGGVAYSTPISKGPIVSSDTCGVAWQNGKGFVGGDGTITCLDAQNGRIIWVSQVHGFAGRQICTLTHDCVYYTTLDGVVGALNLSDGLRLWEIKTTDLVIVAPISTLNENLILIADGYLNVLYAKNGKLLQRVPVGHSPYSMLSLSGEHGLLGAGEPPHNGLLFGFKIGSFINEQYKCQVQCSNGFLESKFLDILISITNTDQEIISARLDGSIFHMSTLHGERVSPSSFTFRAPLSRSACSGDYVIPLFLHLASGDIVTRPILFTFTRREPLPHRARINFITDIKQEKPTYSGSAIGSAIKKLYENREVEQSSIREMVDASRLLGGYEPHDTWRIILRRVLTSAAQKKEELPEFNPRT